MDNRDRILIAFNATRPLGIPDAEEDKNKDLMEAIIPQRPSKRPHFGEPEQGDKAFCKNDISRQNRFVERDGAMTAHGKGNKESSQQFPMSNRDKRAECCSLPGQSCTKSRDHIPSEMASREKTTHESASFGPSSQQPNAERRHSQSLKENVQSNHQRIELIKSRTGEIVNNSVDFARPTPMLSAGSSNLASKNKDLMEAIIPQRPSKRPHFGEPEQGDKAFCKNDISRKNRFVERDGAMTALGKGNKESSQQFPMSKRDKRAECCSLPGQSCTKSRDHIPSEMASREKTTHESASLGPSSQQPNAERRHSQSLKENAQSNHQRIELIKSRTGEIVNNSVDFARPTPMLSAGSSNLASKNKDLMEAIIPQRPSKRPHFGEPEQGDKAFCKNDISRKNRFVVRDGAMTALGKGNKESSQHFPLSKRDKRAECCSLPGQSCTKSRDHVPSEMASREKTTHESASFGPSSQQPNAERRHSQSLKENAQSNHQRIELIKSRTGEIVNNSVDFARPTPMLSAGSSNLASKNKDLMEAIIPQRPSKRPHFGEPEQGDKAFCKNDISRQNRFVERDGAMTAHGKGNKESSQQFPKSKRDKRAECCSLPAQSCTKSRDHIPSEMASREKTTHERASFGPSSQHPNAERCHSQSLKENAQSNHQSIELIKSRTGEIVNNSVDFAQPTPMLSAGSSNLASQCDVSGSMENTCCESSFVIVSSAMGEVKISLSCKISSGKPKFQLSHVNAVMKGLEDIYIKVRKLAMPEFSIMTLLKDLCEKCVALGAGASSSFLPFESSPETRKVPNSVRGLGPNKRPHVSADCLTAVKKKASDSSGYAVSQNLLKVQHWANTSSQNCLIRNLNDITKGTENVIISLVDEVGDEDLPKFTYMPHNVIYQDACMQFSLARIADVDCCIRCPGDCLSRWLPCACAGETGGEFAYTQQGLLREEFLADSLSRKRKPREDHFVFCQDCPLERSKYPSEHCKGHLVRKFIKECWIKCGCNMKCGNRVVQRGITCKLQVFFTRDGKGWGLRTLEDLPQGAFVCEYVGEILTNTELYNRNKKNSGSNRHTYPVTLDADWGSEKVLKDHEALCLDATSSGNVARFINHRCGDANLIDIPVQVETPDRHYYHLAFFTTREVTALEELTWDYGIDFDDIDHPIKAFQCCCGSTVCRRLKQKGTTLPSCR